jgi:transcriptional regulator with XRE-family HTH domain
MPNGFGDFLRSRRLQLTPAAAGLPEGRRRRTPGLRREEVAELAGIGVDWYVRLEQGRAVSPSATTIDSLAAALRLDDAEHAHLRALAGGDARPAFTRETVPEVVRRVVEGMSQPAYVTGRRWDLLAWNAAAEELFGDFSPERNILVYLLLDPAARKLFGDGWAAYAQHVVAQFRVAHDLAPADPAFAGMLARLRRDCPEFETWWDRHDIHTAATGRKIFHHPVGGELPFDYATFQANADPALKLTVYQPVTAQRSSPGPARAWSPGR